MKTSVEPGAAYAAFRGRGPTVLPLLRKRGLVLDVGGYYKNVITFAPSLHISLRSLVWVFYGAHLTGWLRRLTKMWFILKECTQATIRRSSWKEGVFLITLQRR